MTFSCVFIASLLFAQPGVSLEEARGKAAEARRLKEQGKLDPALTASERALDLARRALPSGGPDLLPFLDLAADVADERGDYTLCERLYREALAIRRKHPSDRPADRVGLLLNLRNLGQMCEHRGDYGQAEKQYRETLDIYESLYTKKKDGYAILLRGLGTLYQRMGDYRRAESTLKEARELTLMTVGEKHQDHAQVLAALGRMYHNNRKYSEAETHLKQALDIARALPKEEAFDHDEILSSLANVYRVLKKYPEAEKLHREALDGVRKSVGEDHPTYATASHAFAMVLDEMGKGDEAATLLRSALDIKKRWLGEAHPSYGASLRELASLYEARGQNERAEPLLRQSLRITRDLLDLNLAAGSERQQLALVEDLHNRLALYLSLTVRGKLPAEAAYEQVLMWKGIVFARQQRLRQERNNPESADDLRQLRALAGELGRVVRDGPGKTPVEEWGKKVESLWRRKDELESRLASRIPPTGQRPSLQQVRQLLPEGTVLIDFIEYDHFIPPKNGKGAWTDEFRVAAFVVKREGPIVLLELGHRESLRVALERWRKELTGEPLSRFEQTPVPSERMRKEVWLPLEPHVKGAKTVFLSPDGVLGRCPFGALPGSRPGSYLIEEHALATIPVPQLLPETMKKQRDNDRESLLVLGGVDFGAVPGQALAKGSPREPERHTALRGDRALSYSPLPGTEREADAVGEAFRKAVPSGVVEEVRSQLATESALRERAPGKRYLHLATHGFFSPIEKARWKFRRDPGPSKTMIPIRVEPTVEEQVRAAHPGLFAGIVLAGANRGATVASDGNPLTDDGILTALEVAELDLRQSELVVLSACETGLGESARGEGLLGLQRAFQVSGARSVVASLWKVDDEATRLLMARFYDNLWRRKMGRLQALREAQLSLLNDTVGTGTDRGDLGSVEKGTEPGTPVRTSPRLWAAWMLSGDPGDLTMPDLSPVTEATPATTPNAPEVVEKASVLPWVGVAVAILLAIVGTALVISYRSSRRGNPL